MFGTKKASLPRVLSADPRGRTAASYRRVPPRQEVRQGEEAEHHQWDEQDADHRLLPLLLRRRVISSFLSLLAGLSASDSRNFTANTRRLAVRRGLPWRGGGMDCSGSPPYVEGASIA
jgi:hypothetical protein